MKKINRFSLVAVLVAMLVVAAESRSVLAQVGISFGGSAQSTKKNKRDDDDDDNRSQSNNRGNNSSQSGNPNVQQFQKYLQGGQNNQSGQYDNNQKFYRGSNQQGQFPNAQQFQNQQQFQGQNSQDFQQNGFQIGKWQGGKWQGPNNIQTWTKTFGGQQQPFSSQWYKDHPKAWKYNHPHSDVWVVASVPGVYSWLGWGNYPQGGNVNYGNVQQVDPTAYGDWYPLGVYSLMAGPGDTGTRIVQLAIDRNGNVAGNYYDMISNSAYNISGKVGRQSQRVTFSLNKNQFIKFRAHITQLLQPYGSLSVQLPGGEQQWQFVRLEN